MWGNKKKIKQGRSNGTYFHHYGDYQSVLDWIKAKRKKSPENSPSGAAGEKLIPKMFISLMMHRARGAGPSCSNAPGGTVGGAFPIFLLPLSLAR